MAEAGCDFCRWLTTARKVSGTQEQAFAKRVPWRKGLRAARLNRKRGRRRTNWLGRRHAQSNSSEFRRGLKNCSPQFPHRSVQPRERLFLEIGVDGFPMQRTAANDAVFSERHDRARGATTLDSSPAARAGQHVATSHVVPAHQVGLDCVFPEQHRHRIVDMSGRNVSVRVHALQSLNQSLFECVAQDVFQLDTIGSLCKLGGRQPSADGRGPRGAWLDDPPPSSSPSRLYGHAAPGAMVELSALGIPSALVPFKPCGGFRRSRQRRNAFRCHAFDQKTTGDLRLDDRRLGIIRPAIASRPVPKRIDQPARDHHDISVLPKSCYRRSLNCDKMSSGDVGQYRPFRSKRINFNLYNSWVFQKLDFYERRQKAKNGNVA